MQTLNTFTEQIISKRTTDFQRVVFFWIFFLIFLNFFLIFFLAIPFKVTKGTTKSYHVYYWTQKIAKNGPKKHKGRSPLHELEVGPRSGPYHLVLIICTKFESLKFNKIILGITCFHGILSPFLWAKLSVSKFRLCKK